MIICNVQFTEELLFILVNRIKTLLSMELGGKWLFSSDSKLKAEDRFEFLKTSELTKTIAIDELLFARIHRD